MNLTGTQEERVAAAIEFFRARRTRGRDFDSVAEAYRKAGVPFSEAAEKLFREWNGVFDGGLWYEEGDSYRLDFFMDMFNCDFSLCKAKYAPADAVPVGYGGYYYPGYIFVRPDGKLLMWHDYYVRGRFSEYDTLGELVQDELASLDVGCVEKIADIVLFEGSVNERLLAAVNFARKHGGFKNCRLIRYNGFQFDTGRMPGDLSLPDGELCALLLKILEAQELLGEHDIQRMFVSEE